MSWASVAAAKSVGTPGHSADIDMGKTQLGAIAAAGETSSGGSNTLVNKGAPAVAAAGGKSVAAAGAGANPTGKKKNKNYKKKKAALDAGEMATKSAPATAQDKGNRLGATDVEQSSTAAPKKNKNKARRTKKYQKTDGLEAAPAENKKHSSQMQQFQLKSSTAQKGPSVVDPRAEHAKSFVPSTISSNAGHSVTGKPQVAPTEQADTKSSKSTFWPTAILTKPKPMPVAPADQLDQPQAPQNPPHAPNSPPHPAYPPFNRFANPPLLPSSIKPSPLPTPHTLITSLNLPGISYDRFGVCISPSAPTWVRGRIARRAQILVTELEQGIYDWCTSVVDHELELEMEKKEKAFFGEVVWRRLFEVEVRTGGEEERVVGEVEGLMREWDEMRGREMRERRDEFWAGFGWKGFCERV